MTPTACALIVLAGLIHAGWNIVAKKAGGDARFAALEARILNRVLQKPQAASVDTHQPPADQWPGIAAHGLRWAI